MRTSELGIVLTPAPTALPFYSLFRGVDTVVAGALAASGRVNGHPVPPAEQRSAAGKTSEAVTS